MPDINLPFEYVGRSSKPCVVEVVVPKGAKAFIDGTDGEPGWGSVPLHGAAARARATAAFVSTLPAMGDPEDLKQWRAGLKAEGSGAQQSMRSQDGTNWWTLRLDEPPAGKRSDIFVVNVPHGVPVIARVDEGGAVEANDLQRCEVLADVGSHITANNVNGRVEHIGSDGVAVGAHEGVLRGFEARSLEGRIDVTGAYSSATIGDLACFNGVDGRGRSLLDPRFKPEEQRRAGQVPLREMRQRPSRLVVRGGGAGLIILGGDVADAKVYAPTGVLPSEDSSPVLPSGVTQEIDDLPDEWPDRPRRRPTDPAKRDAIRKKAASMGYDDLEIEQLLGTVFSGDPYLAALTPQEVELATRPAAVARRASLSLLHADSVIGADGVTTWTVDVRGGEEVDMDAAQRVVLHVPRNASVEVDGAFSYVAAVGHPSLNVKGMPRELVSCTDCKGAIELPGGEVEVLDRVSLRTRTTSSRPVYRGRVIPDAPVPGPGSTSADAQGERAPTPEAKGTPRRRPSVRRTDRGGGLGGGQL